jgi:hypothetical protein
MQQLSATAMKMVDSADRAKEIRRTHIGDRRGEP